MRLLLIDAYYYMYRSFYAIRHLRNSKGEPTNAVYGVIKTFQKMIQDLSPDRAAVVFDLGAPAARLALQKDYKANRPETPPDLKTQFPVIERVIDALGFPRVAIEGEEADDLIAAYVRRAEKENYEVILATNDKDLMQLVSDHCRVYQTEKDTFQLLGIAEVQEKWGVSPAQIKEILALTGDAVDNIPGVPGIGPKTAAQLIQAFQTAENVILQAEKITSPKTQAAIQAHREQIFSNLKMVQLRDDLTLPMPIEKLVIQPDIEAQRREFEALEFKSFLNQLKPAQKASSAPVQGELF
ncbi:MAG: 5'-3' exonuclease [Verrucomicrobiota bacterium]